MQQLSNSTKCILMFVILMLAYSNQKTIAQCTPPLSQTCASASVLCSLDELNGYSCTNTSTVPSSCSPICSQGGSAENTSWIGFTTNGGNVTVTLNVGNCSANQGLEFGILYNCKCGSPVSCHSVPCVSPGSSQAISATLSKCKDYYLWVDGCNGDVCDFTINTTGGSNPLLDPLGFINNKSNGIIGPICKGCYKGFYVNGQSEDCNVNYVWTLDGNVLQGQHYENIEIIIPNNGVYQLCVTAFLLNPKDPSVVCDQQGPQCATVIVSKLDDRIGKPRTLCWETVNPSGFKWHKQKIYASGIYREPLKEGNCCEFDSIVEFTVLEQTVPANVYFIGCENTPYIDMLGRKYFSCRNKYQIQLPKSTNPYKCDSSIILTSVDVDLTTKWTTECINGMIDLIPNLNLLKPCFVGESYEFEYKWYKKSEPSNILGTNERLLVNSFSEDYCLEVKIYTRLENQFVICKKTFCETIDEGNSAPDCPFTIEGYNLYCFDPIGKYKLEQSISTKVNFYTWVVSGGVIVSNPDSSAVDIKWSLNKGDTGNVCATYTTDCGTSCQKCKNVYYSSKIAGDDFEHRGLSAYLDAIPNPNGMWRLISGPYPVRIEDPTFARTKITAYNYGYYCFEWTISNANCTLKDTICVNLHNFKKASPEYPKLLFFERAHTTEENQTAEIIFTPNLIQNSGESFLTLNGVEQSKMNYRWFDIFGRILIQDEILVESGLQKMNIDSPKKEGMYFLVVELNGVYSVRKVCVIE